jgi:uncharacterized membrane protein (DUF106 family)
MSIIAKIFGGGAKEVIGAVGGVLDNLITNKEELALAKLEAEKEINRAFEAIQANATKQYEIEVQDRSSARTRETEFVKATGHIDYLMWFLAISAILIFGYMVYRVIDNSVPESNRELIFHIFGIVEGVLLSIFSYYFGSSAGSRIKDMRK